MTDDELAQALISDGQFREWFTKLDFPEPGEYNITLALFVASLPKTDGEPLEMTVMALAVGDAFNDTKQRFALMRMLGARCRDDGMQPVAVALTSEVWIRTFTPEEERARGNRQVSDYEDREEWAMLCGATIDGRAALIRAPLLRNADAVITGYGPRVSSYDEDGLDVEPTLAHGIFPGLSQAQVQCTATPRRRTLMRVAPFLGLR